MKKFYLLAVMAFAIVSFTACSDDDDNSSKEEITECPFCGQEFKSEHLCLEHQNSCDTYQRREGDCSFIFPEIDASTPFEFTVDPENFDFSKWVSRLPDDTRISDLTIPGLHDAATYSYDGSITPTYVKDQALDYYDAWKWGARAFDLRLGYDSRRFQGSFEDRCKFMHGDNFAGSTLGVCYMHNFKIDITGHFPTKEQLKDEFMILITKDEFHSEGAEDDNIQKLDVFRYFMRLMIQRYGADSFIAYSPDLTVKDCRGKIILFTRETEFTKDYSVAGVPSVPVTFIKNFPDDGTTDLTVYQNGTAGAKCQAYVQDHYNIGSNAEPSKKYEYFTAALKNRKEKAPHMLFFNGMNGVQDKPSWDVCEFMNFRVPFDMMILDDPYKQQMGIVMTDFYGVTTYDHGWLWEERFFSGVEIAEMLTLHNFRIMK